MDTDSTQMDTDGLETKKAAGLHGELTEKIIGAAFTVHRELGPGFLGKVYEEALRLELKLRGVVCAAQVEFPVSYKDEIVGRYLCDLLVDGKVICEIKAIDALGTVHEAQLLNYLKASAIRVGLLMNFGTTRLQIKRMIL